MKIDTRPTLAAALTLTLALPAIARAADEARPVVGDAVNGAKLFEQHCKSRYTQTGIGLFSSDRMNLMTDAELYARVGAGECVTDEQKEKFDPKKLGFLDKWDLVAFMRTLHLNLSDFFPDAGRYVAKTYTIDKYGLDRIAQASRALGKGEESAAVFTFFDFPDEKGRLAYVPQDPIQLDQLKKDQKAGYLVFLPMKHAGFEGELGIGMDKDGVITKLMVHPDAKGAAALNAELAKLAGLGRKGQTQPFALSGAKPPKEVAAAVFPLYLRAMETVTMYDREENERTWAD